MAKTTVKNWPMFGSVSVPGASMATSQTSSISEISYQDNIGILVDWTGSSPVGTLTVNVSNDQQKWEALDFGSTISVSGNTGNHVFTLNQVPFTFIELVYTRVSGTGTIFASLSSKRVGA